MALFFVCDQNSKIAYVGTGGHLGAPWGHLFRHHDSTTLSGSVRELTLDSDAQILQLHSVGHGLSPGMSII